MKTNLREGTYEFPFTQDDFEGLRNIVTSHTGIELPDSKKSLMYSRLVRRLRHHKLKNFSAYHNLLKSEIQSGETEEMEAIVNAMTTNVTNFFREQHHFDHLAEMLPVLQEKYGHVNIWSSASSIGAEPWSAAMVVHQFVQKNPAAKVNIYASDIDSHALQTAQNGFYELQEADVNSHPLLKTYMKKSNKPLSPHGEIEKASCYEVAPALRPLITFKNLNLLKPWPSSMPQQFHIIFCRNVIIYFSRETKTELFSRMAPLQPEGSFLYIGHSESLIGISDAYTPLGKTIYKKK